MPGVAETEKTRTEFVCKRRRHSSEVFYYLSNLTLGHWWRSLGRLTAVRGAAVCPQWDLGLVWLPPRQIAQIFGIFGILIGQLLLQKNLNREQQQKYQRTTLQKKLRSQVSFEGCDGYCSKTYFLVCLKETEVSKKSTVA